MELSSGGGILKFIQKHSRKMGDAPIITALVANDRMHFIAHPAAFTAPFRYPESKLTMQPVIRDFARSFFGISAQGWEGMSGERSSLKPVADHLLKVKGLSKTSRTVQTAAQSHLAEYFKNINSTERNRNRNRNSRQSLSLDLVEFLNEVLFRSVMEALISKAVAHREFVETYQVFDRAMFVAFGGLPMKIFAKESYAARSKLIQWLKQDMELSDYMRARQEVYKAKDIALDDVAKDALLWVWASTSNFLPTVFWFIYFTITNQEALEAIREEVGGILKNRQGQEKEEEEAGKNDDDGNGNDCLFTMEELDSMVNLDSVFQETLRVTLSMMISRGATQDMEIDLRLKKQQSKFFIQKGDRIVMFTQLLHHDPHLYPNPETFIWNRFVSGKDNSKSIPAKLPDGETVTEPFRPFGGGSHYCPGRKFALNSAKALVAHLVHNFDLSISGEAIPDPGRDGLGTLLSKNPVQIQLIPRNDV